MGIELARAFVRVRGDASQVGPDLQRSRSAIEGQVGRMAGNIQGMLSQAFAAAGFAGGVAGFVGLIRSGEEFEQKMRNSLAIMDDVSDSMKKNMRDTAFEVARTTKSTAAEAVESYFFLASAGMNAAQSVAALPQVAQFAQAGMFDMAKATDLATDAQSALGLDAADAAENLKNLTRVTDVLVKANQLSNASVEGFSTALTTKAATAARQYGKDIEEVTAVLAVLAKQGVKGQLAGTQLAIVLRDLSTKAIQNKAAFAAAGVSVFDSNNNFRNMGDIVADLEKKLAGMSDATKKATLLQLGFNDRSLSALTTLIGFSGQIKDWEAEMRKAGGTTKAVADKQLTPLQKSMAKLGAAATLTGTKLLETFGPSIQTGMAALRVGFDGLSKALSGVSGDIIAASTQIAGLALAFKGATIAARALGLSVKGVLIASGIGALIPIAGAAVVGLKKLFTWIGSLKPVQEAVARATERFGKAWTNLRAAASNTGRALFQLLRNITLQVGELLGVDMSTFPDTFGKAMAAAIDWASKFILRVSAFLRALTTNWKDTFDFFKLAARAGFSAMSDIVSNFFESLVEVFKKLPEFAFRAASGMAKVFLGGIQAIAENIPKLFSAALAAVGAGLNVFVSGSHTSFQAWLSSFKAASLGMRGTARTTFTAISVSTQAVTADFRKLLGVMFDVGVAAGGELFGEMMKQAESQMEKAEKSFGGIGQAMQDAFQEAGGNDALDEVNKRLKETRDEALADFGSLGRDIAAEFSGIFDLSDATKELMRQVREAFKRFPSVFPDPDKSKKEGKGAGKAAAKGVEEAAAEAEAKVPVQGEMVGFLQLGKKIQEALSKGGGGKPKVEVGPKEEKGKGRRVSVAEKKAIDTATKAGFAGSVVAGGLTGGFFGAVSKAVTGVVTSAVPVAAGKSPGVGSLGTEAIGKLLRPAAETAKEAVTQTSLLTKAVELLKNPKPMVLQ